MQDYPAGRLPTSAAEEEMARRKGWRAADGEMEAGQRRRSLETKLMWQDQKKCKYVMNNLGTGLCLHTVRSQRIGTLTHSLRRRKANKAAVDDLRASESAATSRGGNDLLINGEDARRILRRR